ncbi:MAG: hypothetical protein ACRD1B_04960 [Thermoanaerobaculia bacterium]
MAHLMPEGTPSRTDRYLMPRSRLRFLLSWSVVGAGAALVLWFAMTRVSVSIASPGPTSTSHATFETRCAACHAPKVSDVRCESCHDPQATNRYQNAAHVWSAKQDRAAVARAAALGCVLCHTEHRGRDLGDLRMSDFDCRSCHFGSLEKHPEFRLLKTGTGQAEGMHFSHKRHLKEMTKAKLEECQYCHEPAKDGRSFEPYAFDRNCAKCHNTPRGTVGATLPFSDAAVILPDRIGAPWALALAGQIERLPDRQVRLKGVAHREPWVLFNLRRLAREIDRGAVAQRKEAVEKRIEEISAQLKEPASRSLPPEALRAEESRMVGRLASAVASPAERRSLLRQLERVRVQLELGPHPMAVPRQRDRHRLEAELGQLKGELTEIAMSLEDGAPRLALSREERLAAADAISTACAQCHILTDAAMAPVRLSGPIFSNALFSHRPHLQMACVKCHAGIPESKKAEDLNQPGVASCRDCHGKAKSRADCVECHVYHPAREPWPPI